MASPETTIQPSYQSSPELPEQPENKINILRALRRQWKWAALAGTIVFGGFVFQATRQVPVFRSESLILMQQATGTPLTGENQQPQRSTEELSTRIQILTSRPILEKARQKLAPPYTDIPTEEVAAGLAVNRIGSSDVLSISYTGTNPGRIKAILDAVGIAYINYSLESQRSATGSAIRFVEDQLPIARQSLDKSAAAIREFRKRYGIVDPDSYAGSLATSKQEAQSQIQAIEGTIKVTNRQIQELTTKLNELGVKSAQVMPLSVLMQDSSYQQLVGKVQALDLEYIEQSTKLRDNHPLLEKLRLERADLLKLMEKRARSLLKKQPLPDLTAVPINTTSNNNSVNSAVIGSLSSQLLQTQINLAVQNTQLRIAKQAAEKAAQRFQAAPGLQQQYTELQRQFSLNSENLSRFLGRLQELRIQQAGEVTSWQILEPAYLPGAPISPNIWRGVMLGLAAGGLTAAGVALLLDRKDTRVKHVAEVGEIRAVTNLPLVAAIPLMRPAEVTARSSGLLEAAEFKGSPFIESMRSLGLSLQSMLPAENGKLFILTSSLPNEGKSTLTYNLGMALAEVGRRVLVVDADFRKPMLHELSRVANQPGLSNVIAAEVPWREVVRPLVANQLHVLPAGPEPPNPLTLLTSATMSQLLREWRQLYDYVLIDAPPVLGKPDVQSLAVQADAVAMVVAMNGPTSTALRAGLEILRNHRINLLGVVINRVERNHHDSYYSYYSYERSDVTAEPESDPVPVATRDRQGPAEG